MEHALDCSDCFNLLLLLFLLCVCFFGIFSFFTEAAKHHVTSALRTRTATVPTAQEEK